MRKFLLGFFVMAAAVLAGCATNDEAPIFGDVYGIVSDLKSGEPIRNAEVILSPGNRTTVSGSDGHFEFTALEAGQYKISVEANDYENNYRQVTVIPGSRVSCDIHLTPVQAEDIFKISPTNLNFGSTQTQMSVSFTNESTRATDWSLNLGNNSWLSATPTSGNIASGKTQSIVFSVDRSKMSEDKSAIVSISALGNTYTISVQCAAHKGETSYMEIEPLNLDFGSTSTEEIIRIKNTGVSAFDWVISGISNNCLSVSESSGTIQPSNGKVVTVNVDRSKVSKDISASFKVSDGIAEQTVNVTIKAE
jgi:hypothetical protein